MLVEKPIEAGPLAESHRRRTPQGLDHRFVWIAFTARRGLPDDRHAALALDRSREFGHESTLADPRFTREEERPGGAVGAGVPALDRARHRLRSSDKRQRGVDRRTRQRRWFAGCEPGAAQDRIAHGHRLRHRVGVHVADHSVRELRKRCQRAGSVTGFVPNGHQLPDDVLSPRVVLEQAPCRRRRGFKATLRAIARTGACESIVRRLTKPFAIGRRPFVVERREKKAAILGNGIVVASFGNRTLEGKDVDVRRCGGIPCHAFRIGVHVRFAAVRRRQGRQ